MPTLSPRTRARLSALATTLSCVVCVLLCYAAIMAFTGYWPTHRNAYNSYVRQACAWLDGRLDLHNGEHLTWLELAIVDGKYYVTFPPFPSYLMLPFAAIWGLEFQDAWLALAVSAVGVCYACAVYRKCCKGEHLLFFVLFLFLGTGYLFIAFNGWVWFIAQNLCFTLSLMAIYHALKGQGVPSLACWAAAVGCRPMALIYLPLLLWMLYREQRSRFPADPEWKLVLRRWYWILLPLLLGVSYMVLNVLRFGDPLEFGHNYLPEFLRAENGQFHWSYILPNMQALLRLPLWNGPESAVTFFPINGMAFWLTNTLLIAVMIAWIHAWFVKPRPAWGWMVLLPALSFLYVIIICAHRTLGGWHFGNRYLLDVMPWLFLGLCVWKPQSPWFVKLCTPLAVAASAVNLIGTVALYNNWI